MFHAALKAEADRVGRGFQKNLALRVDVRPQYIYKLVHQKSYGSEQIRRKIANALGYEYEEFLKIGERILDGNIQVEAEEVKKSQESLARASPDARMQELLDMTEYVLEADHPEITPALESNIVAFYYAVLRDEDQPKDEGGLQAKRGKKHAKGGLS